MRHKLDTDSNPFSRLHSGSFRGIAFHSWYEHTEHSIAVQNDPLRRSAYRMLRAVGASNGWQVRQAFAFRQSRPGTGVEDVVVPFQLLKNCSRNLIFH